MHLRTCVPYHRSKHTDSFDSSNNRMPTDGDSSMALDNFLGGNSSAMTDTFDTDDLLSAPVFDDSNGELDDFFEPTPIQPLETLSDPQQSLEEAAMFEPTPLRADPAIQKAPTPSPSVPAARQMIDSQGFPVAIPSSRPRQQATFRPEPQRQQLNPMTENSYHQQRPNPIVGNQQLQAAIQSLRHAHTSMKQQQAEAAAQVVEMNGLNTTPLHQHQHAAAMRMQQQQQQRAVTTVMHQGMPPHDPMQQQQQQQHRNHANVGVNPMPMVHQSMNMNPMQELQMRQQQQQQQQRVAPMPHIQQSMNPMHVQSRNVQPMTTHQPLTAIVSPAVPNNHHAQVTTQSPQGQVQRQSGKQPGNLEAYSVAMEKLCETMKRSATSRKMVKQLSGRNLTKQGSQRSLTKQGSQRSLLLTKQNSGRDLGTLARQHSSRTLSRESSFKGSIDGDLLSSSGHNNNSERMTPTRVPTSRRSIHDTKHRIIRDAAPGRGIFRHNSSSSLVGAANNNKLNFQASLQFDDRNLGYLQGDVDTVSSGDTRFSDKTV